MSLFVLLSKQVIGCGTGWSQQVDRKQGDVLLRCFLTLFSVFVDDLASDWALDHLIVGILLYADDIILLAEHEMELQKMLNVGTGRCWRFRLAVNENKTVHFRKQVALYIVNPAVQSSVPCVVRRGLPGTLFGTLGYGLGSDRIHYHTF